MSNIDQVIARSRQPGEFKEKKRFTVARQDAIRKMRKFALASPYNYILELIQAANANGATYIDIQVEKATTTLSYVGGGFTPDQLGQLFDFLFASKDRLDLAALRQLALGVNALMLAEPTRVIIESGRGTLESTTRVVISEGGGAVDVGKPTEALDGTYIRAEGLKRAKLGHSEPRERAVIEQACLTAPVPLLFNDEPIFGYATMRIPKIAGYRRVVTFDEGDFYGAIGIAPTTNLAAFRLLTYGVWVQSLTHSFGDTALGGVISFNRLRKTADHASIVHDEVLDEMWLRLRPYVSKLLGGDSGKAVFDVRELGSPKTLLPAELRRMAKASKTIVVFPQSVVQSPAAEELAREFGEVLGGPVVLFGDENPSAVSVMAAPTPTVFPVLDPEELAFYRRPVGSPPAQPWLDDPSALPAVSGGDLAQALREFDGLSALHWIATHIGATTQILATAYVPTASPARGGSVAEVRIANRAAWVGVVGGIAGFHVVIDLPELPYRRVNAASHDGSNLSVAEVIAGVVIEMRRDALLAVADRILNDTVALDSPNARQMMLAKAANSVMLKFVREPGGLEISLVTTPQAPPSMMVMPLLRGPQGAITIPEMARRMSQTSGLLYAVVDGVEPDLGGIDPAEVLTLDTYDELHVQRMLGEASFVRVDHRDLLAKTAGWSVRDFALGVRDYPLGHLLAEGQGECTPDVERALLQQLATLAFRSGIENNVSEDYRRHARRHLAYYAANVAPDADLGMPMVRRRPLFKTMCDRLASMEQIEAVAARDGAVRMADGWATDAASLKDVTRLNPWQDDGPLVLAPNTFFAWLLNARGLLRTSQEPVTAGEAAGQPTVTFLELFPVAALGLRGDVGIPLDDTTPRRISIVDLHNRNVYYIDGLAARFGLHGELFSDEAVRGRLDAIEGRLLELCTQMVSVLHDRWMRGTAEHKDRVLWWLLTFAEQHIDVIGPDLICATEDAERILQTPLFDSVHGMPVTPRHVLERHLASEGRADLHRFIVPGEGPAHAWMARMTDGRLRLGQGPTKKLLSREAERTVGLTDPDNTVPGLLDWCRGMIQDLRPDFYKTPSFRAQSLGPERPLAESVMATSVVNINVDHWLVRQALQSGRKEDARWVVLAIYAYLNDLRHEISNAHELTFQARLVDSILAEKNRA